MHGRSSNKRGKDEDADAESRFEWGGGAKAERRDDSHLLPPPEDGDKDGKKKKKKPVFEPSGLLREAALTTEGGAVNAYIASEDSAMPVKRWVLIPLKGDETLETIPLHRQEWYLFGKDRSIAHIPTDHPTCSRQHAVLQFRRRTAENEYGDRTVTVVPYLMDLGSANGTFLNKNRVDKLRYVELRHRDMLKFGGSSRDYILLQEDQVKTDKK